jgi:hypothetical protein
VGEGCVPTGSSPTTSKAIHQGHGLTYLAHSSVCVNKEKVSTGYQAVFISFPYSPSAAAEQGIK